MSESIRLLRPNSFPHLIQLCLPLMLAAPAGHAAICSVNSAADDPVDASAKVTAVPPGSWSGANAAVVTLRDCILAANLMTGSTGAATATGMNIDLSSVAGQTITLGDALPLIFNSTTLDGGSGGPVTIDGSNSHRILFVSGLPTIPISGKPAPDGAQPIAVTLHNLVLQHGLAKGGDTTGGGGGMGAGGALFVNQSASVILDSVSFVGNTAHGGNGYGYFGGGGGMGAGQSSYGGGGMGSASLFNPGAGLGTSGSPPAGSGGFGGQGLGQLSVVQDFNPTYFDVDSGSGASGLGLIGGGGSNGVAGGFGGGGGGGGSGGFGGGGGFGATAGGFGGGGGGAVLGNPGGVGGFGGGGGSTNSSGGSGGGNGGGNTSGGGAGFGGAVFVRTFGSLSVQSADKGSSIAGNSVAAGTGFNSGAAAGRGMFLMSGSTTTFFVTATYRVDDNLADDSLATLPTSQGYTAGNGSGANITSQGTGTLILAALDNSYAGTTTVFSGNLQIDGALTASPVIIDGGVLSGNGTVQAITLNAGGSLVPGDSGISPGTLHGSNMTWNGGGEIDFQLGMNVTGSDMLVLSGALTKGTAGAFVFHFGQGSGVPAAGTTYTLISAASTTFTSTDFSFVPFAPLTSLTGNFSVNNGAVQFTVTSATSDRIFANGFD